MKIRGEVSSQNELSMSLNSSKGELVIIDAIERGLEFLFEYKISSALRDFSQSDLDSEL